MSITKYTKTCGKTIAGNDYKIYVAPFPAISGMTFTTGSTVSGITMVAGMTFAEIQCDWDSVSYVANSTTSRGSISDQTITGKFTQKTTNLVKLINELKNDINCGLVIIIKDGNGKYWMSGYAPSTDLSANRPYNTLEANFTSGEGIEATEDGNLYTVNFKRMSGTEDYLLETAISTLIDNKTATFITFN